jgi:plastocyanin
MPAVKGHEQYVAARVSGRETTVRSTTMHRFSLARRLALAVAASTALALPVALGSSASAVTAAPVTWHVRVGAESPDMAVAAMSFLPREVWADAGDTVHWTSNSAEPHTVSFLPSGQQPPPFNPFDASQTTRQGGSTYNGSGYLNSGIMATQPIFIFDPVASYDLTFTTAGDFTYYCLVHGSMMSGTVHVRAAGTPYPYTQQDYDRVGNQQTAAALFNGRAAYRQARQAYATTGNDVLVGIDGDGFSVMRFVRDRVVVHVGDTVSFATTAEAPHTVTFGQEPPGLGIFAPSGDPTHYSGGDLNSGLLVPGTPFDVTFTAVGTYHYICAIHDDMGMVGDVVVEP